MRPFGFAWSGSGDGFHFILKWTSGKLGAPSVRVLKTPSSPKMHRPQRAAGASDSATEPSSLGKNTVLFAGKSRAELHAEGDLQQSADTGNASAGFESDLISLFVEVGGTFGVPKSVAAIYGLCFLSAAPLSFADISSRLSLSQGSISQGMRVLRDAGALKTVGFHGRREYFTPELELRKLAMRCIEDRVEKQLSISRQKVFSLGVALPACGADEQRVLRERIRHLQNWHKKGRALIPIVKTFLKFS